MKGKPPAFQFYARDWLAATRLMTPVQIGYRIQLWASSWTSDRPGCLPEAYPSWQLAGASSAEEFRMNGGEILLGEFKPDSHGRLVHGQLSSQRREQVAYAKSQQKKGIVGARKRWHQSFSGDASAIAEPQSRNNSASASASASASTVASASSSTSPHFDKGQATGQGPTTTEEPPQLLVDKLQAWHPGFDLEAITHLWNECRKRSPGVGPEAVVAMCDVKFRQKYDPNTGRMEARNEIGFLLTAVPKAFEKPREDSCTPR